MIRRRLVLALIAIAIAFFSIRAMRGGSAPSGAPAPSPMTAPQDAALQAETYVVAAVPIHDTVATIGTLAANESVNVVSELSRRLAKIAVAEGTDVDKGDLLFKLDDEDLKAKLAELDVQRQLSARTEERQRALLGYDKKALSQQAYDQAVAELRGIEAQMTSLRVTLAKTEIRAPFHARVGLRRVSEGAWITPEIVMTTLQDTSRIKIDFSLPERHAGAVAIGTQFSFRVASRAESFEGRVIAIEPVIDAPTRSVMVRGLADNTKGTLIPGAFATVEVPIERPLAGMLIPAQALVPSATGYSAFVLREGRAALQEVETGLRTRDSVEIVRGLQMGDTVITSNLLRMRPGVRVEPVAVH